MNKNYGNFLTILLVIIIIAIVAIIGFLGYKVFESVNLQKKTDDFVENNYPDSEEENEDIDYSDSENNGETKPENENQDDSFADIDFGEKPSEEDNKKPSKNNKPKLNGYSVDGVITIPVTKVNKMPIISLENNSGDALETSVVMIYSHSGLNEPGVTTIAGHNMRTNKFFSKNKRLNVGDKIIIKDNSGRTLTYKIYDKFETTAEDTSFITKNTEGAIEVALQTCTDNSQKRLIILARAEV